MYVYARLCMIFFLPFSRFCVKAGRRRTQGPLSKRRSSVSYLFAPLSTFSSSPLRTSFKAGCDGYSHLVPSCPLSLSHLVLTLFCLYASLQPGIPHGVARNNANVYPCTEYVYINIYGVHVHVCTYKLFSSKLSMAHCHLPLPGFGLWHMHPSSCQCHLFVESQRGHGSFLLESRCTKQSPVLYLLFGQQHGPCPSRVPHNACNHTHTMMSRVPCRQGCRGHLLENKRLGAPCLGSFGCSSPFEFSDSICFVLFINCALFFYYLFFICGLALPLSVRTFFVSTARPFFCRDESAPQFISSLPARQSLECCYRGDMSFNGLGPCSLLQIFSSSLLSFSSAYVDVLS